jgi:hypothetical protein
MDDLDLCDPKLHTLLLAIDRDLAAQTRRGGCGHCGGVLHSAQYPRKARGLHSIGPGLDSLSRFSFCCETCRRRSTPASVRFLGRRAYPAALVLMLSAMDGGINAHKTAALRVAFGVARRTLERWRSWWRNLFVRTRFWDAQRARFMPPLVHDRLPASMLERFDGDSFLVRIIQCLHFLGPVTAPPMSRQFDGR